MAPFLCPVTQRTPWHRIPLSTEGALPIIFSDPSHPINSPIAMDTEGLAQSPAADKGRGKKRADPEPLRAGAKVRPYPPPPRSFAERVRSF
jgi:hypothetical protein